MRKLNLLPLFLIGTIVIFFSCSKKKPEANPRPIPNQTIDVKIAPDQPYQINLPDPGTVTINKQALHFSVSEAAINPENGTATYKYTPADGFAGSDEVILLSTKTEANYSSGNSGGCPGTSSSAGSSSSVSNKYITFKITVAN